MRNSRIQALKRNVGRLYLNRILNGGFLSSRLIGQIEVMTAPTMSSSSAELEARCPVCGQGFVQHKSWLVRCAACGFLASTLAPGAGTGIEGLDALRRANFENVLDRLEQHRKLAGLRLLEVGCSTGLFLEVAARRGADVQGIEPELKNALFSRKKGLRVQSGFFPQDLDDRGRYDIIAFNDVFEHLPDPVESLKAVEQLLRPFGIAILNLPSSDGVLYKTATLLDRVGYGAPLERLWQKGLPSPHVSHAGALRRDPGPGRPDLQHSHHGDARHGPRQH